MYPINITEYLENCVQKYPNRLAVRDGNRSLTFRQLHERVLMEAARIKQEITGASKQIIAVFLPKSIEAVIADLAILYSGNAYMNLDVKSPLPRLSAIFSQTSPTLCISEKNSPQICPCPLFNLLPLDKLLTEDKEAKLNANLNHLIDTDLLCLINTSGSTGIPKTVALNHRSFIDFVEAVKAAGLAGQEIIGSLSPAIFDIFSFELCLMMAEGATLELIPETLAAFPLRMLQLMRERDVSFIFWVPTIMVNIANMRLLDEVDLPKLKMIWFAGEVFPTPKFNYWFEKLPQATFANFYGPIEITLDCLYHVVKKPLDPALPIPIGKPFRNTAILVLDDAQRAITAATPGMEGELCVRGSSLAAGYYNNPLKTAEVFVQNPINSAYPEHIYRTGDIVYWNDDGDLVFKGRKDTLIKHSGYRIELGEIEMAAINALPDLTNVCAVYDKTEKEICLIYEATNQLDNKQLRLALSRVLPRYMVPHKYYWLQEMPRNANGKIDRKLLGDKFVNHSSESHPQG